MSDGVARDLAIHLKSIGCRTNQEELATLKSQLQHNGFAFTDNVADAKIVIVNTCAVTAHTESKTKRLLQAIVNKSPHAKILVTGCLAQQQPKNLAAIKGIHWVVGNTLKQKIPQLIIDYNGGIFHNCFSDTIETGEEFCDNVVVSPQDGLRTRYAVKIQEGCNYRCTYCIVPQLRGPARSWTCESVVDLCRRVIDAGYREIILTGTHIGQFRDRNCGFYELLLKIIEIKGDFRVRLSSLDPRDLTDELLHLIGSHYKVCDHLHVSVQNFDRAVLNDMGRSETDPQKVCEQLAHFRSTFPMAGLGADIIVGFPKETDNQFNAMCSIVQKVGFSYAHIFRYSSRPGTAAENFRGALSEKEKSTRSKMLQGIIEKSRNAFINHCIGKMNRIIVESEKPVRGLTSNYLHLEVKDALAVYNSWLNVKITGILNNRYCSAEPFYKGE